MVCQGIGMSGARRGTASQRTEETMEIDLALLADAATIDGSGKLNVLGVFDRINASEFPVRHGRVALVLRFHAGIQESGEHEVEIVLRDPRDEEKVRLDGSIQFGPGPMQQGGEVRVPHVLNLDGLVFEQAGRYAFDIRVDDDHLRSIPLTIVDRSGPGGPARA